MTKTILVRTGDFDRDISLVQARIPAAARVSEVARAGELSVVDLQTDQHHAAQFDPVHQQITFVASNLLAGGERRFEVRPRASDAETRHATSEIRADRIIFEVDRQQFASYMINGTRRPYLWPVLGPSGSSVVRGQGTSDHPHHTGANLSYGGHSEGGSVNIWSDWDEPPYGPGGRMVHLGITDVASGPVFGSVTHTIAYTDSDGRTFCDERRTVRWWWANAGLRFIDLTSTVDRVDDRGNRPFIMSIRTPPSLAVTSVGAVTNSEGRPSPTRWYGADDRIRARWIDASGPSGVSPAISPQGPPEDLFDLTAEREKYDRPGDGPWEGIALVDHPNNHGYPNVIGKYAMAEQLTQSHYPPADAPNGPFSFSTRLIIHEGDAKSAGIDALAQDYADPCDTTWEGHP